MLFGKDQHLACITAKGTFDTKNAVTDSELLGGRLAYAVTDSRRRGGRYAYG